MARKRRVSRPPADPAAPDPLGVLPSDQGKRSVTVKLDTVERRMLGQCRRLLSDSEGDTYPTASRTFRLALATLYHALTGHPPEGASRA